MFQVNAGQCWLNRFLAVVSSSRCRRLEEGSTPTTPSCVRTSYSHISDRDARTSITSSILTSTQACHRSLPSTPRVVQRCLACETTSTRTATTATPTRARREPGDVGSRTGRNYYGKLCSEARCILKEFTQATLFVVYIFHLSVYGRCCFEGSSIHQPIFCCSSHSPDTCPHPVLHILLAFLRSWWYSRTPLIRPPSVSHWCGRLRGIPSFLYEQKPLSITRNVVV